MSPYKKYYNALDSMLGSSYLWKLPHTGGLHERKPLLQGLIGILEVAMSTIPSVYAGPTRIVGRNNDSGLRLIRISGSHAWRHHI